MSSAAAAAATAAVVVLSAKYKKTPSVSTTTTATSLSSTFVTPFTTLNNLIIKKGKIHNHQYYYHHPIKSTPLVFMEWQDCSAKLDVDVPISVAYTCYSDREAIPQWMPFISSVKLLDDKPDTSEWSLKYTAFGQDIKFSWLAKNLEPIPNQKIHWRSLQGLPNRGAVRFFPKGPDACTIELTVSYEVPQLLIPVAAALQPFLQNLLLQGLEQFAKFAKSYSAELPT